MVLDYLFQVTLLEQDSWMRWYPDILSNLNDSVNL